MAETVGLVLGAIPLVIWALEKYAEPFEAYSNYHNHIQTFRSDLRLQERQLQLTLLKIGLRDPTEDELRECVRSKFPDIADEVLHLIQDMDKAMAKLMQKLGINMKQKMSTTPHASLWDWMRIKNSISAKRREAVIDLLRKRNADLQRCLQVDQSEVPAEDDNPVVQDLSRRFSMERCNALRLCLGSLHRALADGLRCNCLFSHQVALDLDWHLSEPAAQLGFDVAVSYQKGASSWRKLHAAPKYTNQSSGLSPVPQDRTAGPETPPRTPSPLRFLPSRKQASLSISPRQPSLAPIQRCDEPPAIPNLCKIVASNTGEHVLRDRDEVQGRNFSLRHSSSDVVKITRLVPFKELLLPQHHQKLSLKARCGLAAYTAWSVLHLSSGPWLGDDWDGRQVGVFLERCQNDGEKFAERPSFLCDFATPLQTPPDGESSARQGLSAEPNQSPVPNMAVVSLGIMLVELCLGSSLARARQEQQQDFSTLASTTASRYFSAISSLDDVYLLAGKSYGDAAKRCIKFCFSGQDRHNIFQMASFRATFYRDVVAPIQGTYVRFPN